MSSLSMGEVEKSVARFEACRNDAYYINRIISIIRKRGCGCLHLSIKNRHDNNFTASTADKTVNRDIAIVLEEYVSRLESEMCEIEGRFGNKGEET